MADVQGPDGGDAGRSVAGGAGFEDDARRDTGDPGPANPQDLLGEPPHGEPHRDGDEADFEAEQPPDTAEAREMAPGQEFAAGEG